MVTETINRGGSQLIFIEGDNQPLDIVAPLEAERKSKSDLADFDCEIAFDVTFGSCERMAHVIEETLPITSEITYRPSGWCAPKVTIHDASLAPLPDFVFGDSIDFSFNAKRVTTEFYHWWHRPIWWAYRMWKRLQRIVS